MGNKFSRRRAAVDEQYTRTQGLYQHRDVDPRKLRRLILNGQLAPCFPGAEDNAIELDECPICFLFYPSLNRSKCCTKGICTECFLQIKSPHSARPTQCPFCKTSSYVVEYRGAKTVEEKGVEQAEEQKVIEAKIRIRQKELLDEEECMLRREEAQGQDNVPDRFRRNFSNLHGFTLPSNVQACQTENVPEQVPAPQTRVEPAPEGVALLPGLAGRLRGSSFQRLNRGDDFDLDLEEIMVMEAIWLSIQDQGQSHQDQHQLLTASDHARIATNENGTADITTPVQELSETRTLTGRGTVTGGLAGAIAALAERQATRADSSNGNPSSDQSRASNRNAVNSEGNLVSMSSNEQLSRGMIPDVTSSDVEAEQGQTEKCLTEEIAPQTEDAGGEELNNWIEVSIDSGRTISPLVGGESRSSMSDWLQDQSSEAVEVGTSFSSSIPSASDLPWEGSDFGAQQSIESIEEPPGSTQQPIAMLPDSFEEQVMLAMALSLAEAQAQAWRQREQGR
ncbi:hypothetical protein GOP47_0008610 [Adiantum capillus-veneris]|uniref:RING-type domain-containing protein n=1 Tax=Adiantum capillus-veneris TaxID=13818 RepID=A0A9D4UYP2_ADICA|nr:hypothetical protein GOP47_0008610 [Adiantum capillus-veneris]